MRMPKLVFGLLMVFSFLGLGFSEAKAANQSALTWVAPTANTDGTAIVGTLTYNVYFGLNGATLTLLKSGVTTLTYTDTQTALVDGSTACYTVAAVEGGTSVSAQSAQGCKTFPVAVPSAPTGLIVN